MAMEWQGAPASPSSYPVKRILRLDLPVDTYPNVSFAVLFSLRQWSSGELTILLLLVVSSILLEGFWVLEGIH